MITRIKIVKDGYGTTYIPQWLDTTRKFLWIKLKPMWRVFTTTECDGYDFYDVTSQFKSKDECKAFILEAQNKWEKVNIKKTITYEDYPE